MKIVLELKKWFLIISVLMSSWLLNADSSSDFDKLKQFLIRNRNNELKSQEKPLISADEKLVSDIRGFVCYGSGSFDLGSIYGSISKNEFNERFISAASPVMHDRRPPLFKDFDYSTSEFTTESGTVYKVSLKSKSFNKVSDLKAAYYRVLNGLERRLAHTIVHSETDKPLFFGNAKIEMDNNLTLSLWASTLSSENCLILDLVDNRIAELTSRGKGHEYHDESELPRLDVFLGFRLRDDFATVAGNWTPNKINKNGKMYNYSAPQEQRLLANGSCVVMADNDGKVKLIGCQSSFEKRANANAEIEAVMAKLEKMYKRRFFKQYPDAGNQHLAEWKMRFFASKMKPLADNVEAELTAFIARENNRYSVYIVLLRHENLDFMEAIYEN